MDIKTNIAYLVFILLITACESGLEINCNEISLNVEIDSSQSILISACGIADGKIVLNAITTGSELEYSIDEGKTFQKENVFEQLKPGIYHIGIKDQNQCISTFQEVVIKSGISFQAEISPIIRSYCSLGSGFDGFGCHVPGGRANTNFLIFDEIKQNAQEIKRRVISRNMPRSNSMLMLTNVQIEKIVCWVDDGAPEN